MIDGNDVIIGYKNGSIIDAHILKNKLKVDKMDNLQNKNFTIKDKQMKFSFTREISTNDSKHDTNLNDLKGIFIIEKHENDKSKNIGYTKLDEFQNELSEVKSEQEGLKQTKKTKTNERLTTDLNKSTDKIDKNRQNLQEFLNFYEALELFEQ